MNRSPVSLSRLPASSPLPRSPGSRPSTRSIRPNRCIVLQFGAPLAIETEPGLHAKIPLVQTVAYIDKRLLDLEVPVAGSDRAGQEMSRRRCVCALAHCRSPPLLPALSHPRRSRDQRLTPILGSDTVRGFWAADLCRVLSEKRAQVMETSATAMNQDGARIRRLRSSMPHPPCRSAAPTAKRSIAACSRSANARPTNSAPKAPKSRSASARAPNAKRRC